MPSRNEGWGVGVARGKRYPATKPLPSGRTLTGGWGRVRGPTSVVNGPADADDSVDGILSKPAKGLGHQRHKVQTGGAAG